jgi:hypothetical protein
MIQILSEADVDLSSYFKSMAKLEQEINNIYNRLTFSTIAEIIDGDIDLHAISSKIYEIDRMGNNFYRNTEAAISRMGDEVFEKYDDQLFTTNHNLSRKTMAVEDLIEVLTKLVHDDGKHPIKLLFSDIKPIKQ